MREGGWHDKKKSIKSISPKKAIGTVERDSFLWNKKNVEVLNW